MPPTVYLVLDPLASSVGVDGPACLEKRLDPLASSVGVDGPACLEKRLNRQVIARISLMTYKVSKETQLFSKIMVSYFTWVVHGILP